MERDILAAARLILFVAAIVAGPVFAEAPTSWNPRANELCLVPPYEAAETAAQAELKDILEVLDSWGDPPGSLTRSLRATGAALCLEDRPVEVRGSFETADNLVALKESLTPDEKLVILVHELRHLDQNARGFCPSVAYSRDEMTTFTYAVEADAQAVTTYVVHELAEAGRPGPWQALLGMEHYADIANAFTSAVGEGAGPADAVSRAFDAWYESDWRTEAYYFASCIAYLDELDRTHRLPSYDLLPEDYFDGLCLLPDGSPYPCGIRRPR